MSLVGQTISDRYRLDELFWLGTMSNVYRGVDTLNNLAVVVKVLKESVASKRVDDIIRFHQEASMVSKLSHPGLVQVFEAGEYGNLHYIVMESLDGKSLQEYQCEEEQFSLEEIIWIIRQVAEVLQYVHGQGIIHRDLKPRNIVLVNHEQGFAGKWSVKLLDFGLAQIYDFSQINQPEAIVGTFGYMSPEQSGMIKKDVDERSDLYSLGIIFYNLLTSVLPFTGDSVGTILHRQIAKQPVLPSLIRDGIPPLVEQMVLKLLKKDVDDRYQTAQGLITDLDKFINGEESFALGQGDSGKKLNYRTRVVGREAELEKLKETYDLARQGQGCVCLIVGEAGCGKSRLVEEFRPWVFEQGGDFLWGSCFDQTNRVPYQPFAEALKTLIRITGKMSQAERRDRLVKMKASLGDLSGIITGISPEMKELLGEAPSMVSLEPERDKLRFLNVCVQFFLGLPQVGKPVVIMLDDLHWADEGSLTLLHAILQEIEKHPVVIIGTYRDDEIAATHYIHKIVMEAKEQKLPLEEIKLSNFDLPGVTRMISQLLLDEGEDIDDLSGYIYNKTKGNPFFTIEIIRQLVHENALFVKEGRYVPDWKVIDKTDIPATLVDTILKKIGVLEPELLEILAYGAVLGREFDTDLLLRLVKYSIDELIVLIDQAVALQLLEKGSTRGRFAFVHDRVREAFYKLMSSEERKMRHFEIAYVMESVYSENLNTVIYELAAHFEVIGDDDRTLRYSFAAAEKAKNSYANAEAQKNYKIAIEALERNQEVGTPLWQKAQEGLMEVCLTMGDFFQVIDIARGILTFKTTPAEQARIYRYMATAHFKSGDLVGAEKIIIQGLALLGEKVPQTKSGVRYALGRELFVHTLHASFPKLFLHKEGQPIKPEHRETLNYNFIVGWIYALTDAERFAWSVLRIMNIIETKIGDPKELARSKGAFGSVWMAIAKFDTAEVNLLQSIKLLEEMQDEWGLAQCCQWLGFCYSWKGEHERSISYFLRSKDLFGRLGDSWEQIYSLLGLGSAYRYLADLTKSKAYYVECLQLSSRIKSYMGVGSAMSNLAGLYIAKGDLAQAEQWLDKTLKLSEEKDIKSMKCLAKITLGYLLIRQGKYESAIENLTEAKSIYFEQTSVKDVTVRVFNYLAGAYVERLRDLTGQAASLLVWEQEQTHRACIEALKYTKSWPNHRAAAHRIAGKYFTCVKKYTKAEKYFQKSIKYCKSINLQDDLAKAYLEYGLLLNEKNRPDEAQKLWLEAYKIFQKIGFSQYVTQVQKLLNNNQKQQGHSTWEGPHNDDYYSNLQSFNKPVEKLGVNSFKTIVSYLDSIEETDLLPEKIIDLALELTGAERGCLLLYPESQRSQKTLELKFCRNMEQNELASEDFKFSRTVIKRVEETIRPEIVYDAGSDDQLKAEMSVVLYELRSIMCYPLVARGKMLGLIYLDNRLVGGLFNSEKLDFLKPFFAQAALVIDNTRLRNRLRKVEKVRPKDVPENMVDGKSRNELADNFSSFYKLTNRERQILLLLFEGMKNDLIQEKLHISGNTLKTHLKNIYSKLKINSRKELLSLFVEFIEKDPATGVGGI